MHQHSGYLFEGTKYDVTAKGLLNNSCVLWNLEHGTACACL